MAQRRMFSTRIASSARFLQMPTESQLLYFHLCLHADDDGVAEAYPVLKLLNVASDAFKVLLAKGFIRQLNEDQVIVITDWLEHNTIRADRKIDSIYKPLLLDAGVEVIAPKPRSDVADNSRRLGGPSTDGIGKVRLGKDRITTLPPVRTTAVEGFDAFWKAYPRKVGRLAAQHAWAKLPPTPSLGEILSALSVQSKSKSWQRDGGRYIPHPATWLNQGRWMDETAPEEPSFRSFVK